MSKPLLNALPELIEARLITSSTARKIEQYYLDKSQSGSNRLNVIFGIIGAALVGLGIILILAHNWDQLSRTVKVLLSFTPLAVGQMLCGYSLLVKTGNTTWGESSACFLFFSVAASISLVAQVYNIPGNFGAFLYTWMLLSFPLIYLMPSSIVSLLYLAGITVYAVNDGYGYRAGHTYHYWWLLLLALPHYLSLIMKKAGSGFTFLHHWAVPLSLTICLGTLLKTADGLQAIAYAGLFTTFCFVTTQSWLDSQARRGANGFAVIGLGGLTVIFLIASFIDFWQDAPVQWSALSVATWLGVLVPTGIAIALLVLHFSKVQRMVDPLLFAFPAFYVIFIIGKQSPFLGALLTNFLILASAILVVLRGLRLNNFAVLNGGLLVIAALVTCRFFDTNISFVVRGLLFIVVGAAFFFANSLLLKKRRAR